MKKISLPTYETDRFSVYPSPANDGTLVLLYRPTDAHEGRVAHLGAWDAAELADMLSDAMDGAADRAAAFERVMVRVWHVGVPDADLVSYGQAVQGITPYTLVGVA